MGAIPEWVTTSSGFTLAEWVTTVNKKIKQFQKVGDHHIQKKPMNKG
jgi:hypothetical protein